MKTIRESFKIILTGEMAASRAAARGIRKLVYSHGDPGAYEEIKKILNSAPREYAKIAEGWRQENFVMAVSVMYFLHDREDRPDFLFAWLFHLLEHPNGNVRHAAVRMFENELGPLTYYIRFPGEKSHHAKLTKEQAGRIVADLNSRLEALAASSDKPAYRKYKYIDSLPSGTYKSTQHILACLEDYCGEVDRSTEGETSAEILARRQELEQEIRALLKETKSDFTLEDVKEVIFNEQETDDMTHVIRMFDGGGDVTELENILEVVEDAWNYFPHRIIGGLSPAEKLREYRNRNKN